MNPDTLSSVVHTLCADLAIPHVHLHSIRHFAATEMLAAGIDPRNAAETPRTCQPDPHAPALRARQGRTASDRLPPFWDAAY